MKTQQAPTPYALHKSARGRLLSLANEAAAGVSPERMGSIVREFAAAAQDAATASEAIRFESESYDLAFYCRSIALSTTIEGEEE